MSFQIRNLQKAHSQLIEEHKLQISELRASKENAFETEKQLTAMSRDYEQTKQEVNLLFVSFFVFQKLSLLCLL